MTSVSNAYLSSRVATVLRRGNSPSSWLFPRRMHGVAGGFPYCQNDDRNVARSFSCDARGRTLYFAGDNRHPINGGFSNKHVSFQAAACEGPLLVHQIMRGMSSSSSSKTGEDGENNAKEQHAMFEKQMEELHEERHELFGFTDDDVDGWSNSGGSSHKMSTDFLRQVEVARSSVMEADYLGDTMLKRVSKTATTNVEERVQIGRENDDGQNVTAAPPLQAEGSHTGYDSPSPSLGYSLGPPSEEPIPRQQHEVLGPSDLSSTPSSFQRQSAQHVMGSMGTGLMSQTDPPASQSAPPSSPPPAKEEEEHHDTFTHLSPTGKSATMVDVGHKTVTRRMARARTMVHFPPEVVAAFHRATMSESDGDLDGTPVMEEMTGPKGPIFATAKLAGIMAAKRTSDLIPLCHPLPLDRVHVDISLVNDAANTDDGVVTAVVDCECRVTHKTGVEMEALMGATVAALTIYDMCKAVSHNVVIGETRLISKRGGKRTVGYEDVTIVGGVEEEQ